MFDFWKCVAFSTLMFTVELIQYLDSEKKIP